jgi:hypothetical protein
MQEKIKLKRLKNREENREIALKFEKAEQIRNGHKALQHSKFFHQQLKLLT